MINIIANKLVTYLQALPFRDKLTGIVKTARLYSDTTVKAFPVKYNTNITTCNPSQLDALVPDSKKRSIIYFEDFGTSLARNNDNYIDCSSNLRLVCWFNYNKIGQYHEPSLIALNILKHLPTVLGNFDNLIGVRCEVTRQAENDANCFNRYTYYEEQSQYLTYPYDYVCFDIVATYRIRVDCIDDLTIDEQSCN